MNRLQTSAFIIALTSFATIAEAKRDQREGFNFGLGMRVIGSTDNTKGTGDNDNAKKETSSQAFTPYLGYVLFDTINLGLTSYFENQSSDERFQSKDGSQEVDRQSTSTIKSGSLFLRFMFAKYMHFELGGGIYERKLKVSDQYTKRDDNGKFSGDREEYSSRGIGPGYHAGVGVEVPVVQGFFVSSNFIMRTIQLRDAGSDGSVGKKRSRLENRELSFGLSHYID